tara:strand:- start:2138 stop:2902 length:765 start_codon:yes stop_codon:yes gene_type:complete
MPRKKSKQVEGEQKGQLDDSMNGGLPPIRNPLKTQIKLRQFPWTEKQKDFFKVALNPDTRIVFVDGPAGTSKTLLATYCGLQLLNMRAASDICYLRSAVESSDSHLGFLPGSADDKLRFYNLPFIDKLDELLIGTKVAKLEETGRVSMFPINFARGLHWPDKVIIMDEAQNSTEQEITTVLTRMGKNCRCFVLADPMQTDLRRSTGGFQKMFNIFADEESKEMGIHTFEFTEDDIMRSELVKYLVKKLKDVNNE